jgi:hypothetical protein
LKKGKKELVEARLKDYSKGICNDGLAWLYANCENLGIDKSVFEVVYESFIDLLIKKPVSKEGALAKIDPALVKIKAMTFPEDIEEGNENFKALV